MKSHTGEFKEEIKTLGKQQSVRITYKENNVTKTLTDEDINSATPNYEASLLKSVMKVLELDSNVSIPKGTEIKFEYGLLVNGAYEYLNYGNYIVAKEPEKQEDTLSYKITCYDKMLYSMKDYEHIDIPYPCTIKQYLIALCNKIGLQFKDSDFANASRQITSELFMTINEDGTYSSMGYTYRDVLDQIAETTGGCICITLDDKVEVRYINKTLEYSTSKNTNEVEIETQVKEKVKTINIEGNSYQETTEGYNLLNVPANFTVTNTDVRNDIAISLKANITYTIKAKTISSDNKDVKNCLFRFRYNNADVSNPYARIPISGLKTTYTPRADIDEVWIYSGTGHNESALSNTTFEDLMIYEGTEDKPYEPYTGGIPSPSPDYPQEITNVGENGIKIKQSGKNLFNFNGVTNPSIATYESGIATLTWDRGYNVYFLSNSRQKLTDIDSKKTYTVIFKHKGNSIKMFNYATSQYGVSTKDDNEYAEYKFIITGVDFIELNAIRIATSGTAYIKEIMLYEGAEATSYEPYHEPIITPINLQGNILSKVGDVKDILKINRNGEVEIKKNIGKVVLDGTENWFIGTELANTYAFGLIVDNKTNGAGLCNSFITKNSGISSIDEEFIQTNHAGKIIYIRINKERLTSKDVRGLKTFLSSQKEAGTPVIAYYELATPQIITLPSISPVELWQGTNIFSLVTNLDTEIELEYPTNYDTIDEEYINDTNVNFGEKYRTY